MRTTEPPSEDTAEAPLDGAGPVEVRRELKAILESQPFRTSRQCRDLLQYIVEHSLAGPASELRERIVGIEVLAAHPPMTPRKTQSSACAPLTSASASRSFTRRRATARSILNSSRERTAPAFGLQPRPRRPSLLQPTQCRSWRKQTRRTLPTQFQLRTIHPRIPKHHPPPLRRLNFQRRQRHLPHDDPKSCPVGNGVLAASSSLLLSPFFAQQRRHWPSSSGRHALRPKRASGRPWSNSRIPS